MKFLIQRTFCILVSENHIDMLQRIQSLFLLIITLIHLSLFFVPSLFWEIPVSGNHVTLTLTSMSLSYGVSGLEIEPISSFPWLLFIPNLLVIISSLMTVFQYKDRKRQLKFTRIIFIDIILQYGALAYYFFTAKQELVLQPAQSPGIILPFISLILVWLAARNIRKDEELVRSVDRIR